MILTDEQVTIENIIKRIEKLEVFKADTIADINEITEFNENVADTMEETKICIDGINDWIEFQDQNDYKKYETPTNLESISELLKDNVKDKIVRGFLETHKNISDQDVQRLMAIPMHKRKDFQKEDLDNIEQVYWACKILLEYIGEENEV